MGAIVAMAPWSSAERLRVDHLRGEVARADLAHLPGAHELLERTQCLLDRCRRIGDVQLVEVDAIGAEPAQTVVGGALYVRAARALVVLVDLAPNFVAMIASSRRPTSARPRNSSLRVPP